MSEQRHIPLADCEHRSVYLLAARNIGIGVFNADVRGFTGIRTKLGHKYLDTENHWDTGAPYGSAKAVRKLCALPDGVDHLKNLVGKKGGSLFAPDSSGVLREVARRQLEDGEAPHGTRQGFVDERVDTGERLPDKVYPSLYDNDSLFDFLAAAEEEYLPKEAT